MNESGQQGMQWEKVLFYIAHGVAVVSGVFCLAVGALLLMSYFYTDRIEPLNKKAWEKWNTELRASPENETLAAQVQELDLIARRAFFADQTMVRRGATAMAFGLGIMILCLGIIAAFKKPWPDPRQWVKTSDVGALYSRLRAFMLTAAAMLAIVLIVTGAWFRDMMESRAAAHTGPNAGVAKGQAALKQSVNIPFHPDEGGGQLSSAAAWDEEILKQWPSFRGPYGRGLAVSHPTPALQWNVTNGQGVLWVTNVPKLGFSSPVIWSNRVFLTGADEKEREVYCWNTENGAVNWTRKVPVFPGTPSETLQMDSKHMFAAPTPATDGTRLYCAYPVGDVVCFDFNGNMVWGRNVGVPENIYGHASSLLVMDGVLYVQWEDDKGPKLMAMDKATGAEKWRIKRHDVSWASPVVVRRKGVKELWLASQSTAGGYDPASGSQRWLIRDCLADDVGTSLAGAGDLLFVSSESKGLHAYQVADVPVLKWTWDEHPANLATPLLYDKFLIVCSDAGYITCMDAETGNVLWEEETDNGFYAAPVAMGNLVYCLDVKGVMKVFKIQASKELVATSAIGEEAWSTPALVNGRVYVRTREKLYCFGEGGK